MGHQDREAVGVKRSEKVPWEGLRCGEETGTRLPYLCLPLPTSYSLRVQHKSYMFDHTRGCVCGIPQANLHA